jgi:hypothetical protein
VQDEAEERWLKVQENPLEGVTFTSEDFEKALAKYDFSWDVGDVVWPQRDSPVGCCPGLGFRFLGFLPVL